MPGYMLPSGGGVGLGAATPSNISGASAAVGASLSASHEDHVHALAFGSDAQGDLAVRGASAYGRLALGTSGFVLASNGTTLAYTQPLTAVGGATVSAGSISITASGGIGVTPSGNDLAVKISFASEAHGDIAARGSSAWVRVAAGTSGQFLKTNGAGATPTWADAPVLSVAGRTGAVTVTATNGITSTPSGSDIALTMAFGSDAQGDIPLRGASNYARLAKGSADTMLGVNGAGTTLAYTATPWLTGLHVGAGGSVAASTFGTGSVQAAGDATNGQAYGVRAATTPARGSVAFFNDANAARGQLAYDQTNDRMVLRGDNKGVLIASDTSETKGMTLVANSNNVGFCGATAWGTGTPEGVVSIGPATTVPTNGTANHLHLYTQSGNAVLASSGTLGVTIAASSRMRITAGSSDVMGLISFGAIGPSFGGMAGVGLRLAYATTAPTTNPSNAWFIYGDASGLWARGPSGTITQIALP